jgi:hypothetical protein
VMSPSPSELMKSRHAPIKQVVRQTWLPHPFLLG